MFDYSLMGTITVICSPFSFRSTFFCAVSMTHNTTDLLEIAFQGLHVLYVQVEETIGWILE